MQELSSTRTTTKRSPNRIVSKKYVAAGVTFEPELLRELDHYCDEHFLARAVVVRWSVRNFLNAVRDGSVKKDHE
jgi:hypothetical protein